MSALKLDLFWTNSDYRVTTWLANLLISVEACRDCADDFYTTPFNKIFLFLKLIIPWQTFLLFKQVAKTLLPKVCAFILSWLKARSEVNYLNLGVHLSLIHI